MIESLKDIFKFLLARKKYWLMPIIVALLLVGLIIVFGANSALAPYIYSIF